MSESGPEASGLDKLRSAAQLRRMWKPRRDSYSQAGLYEDVRIRVHRCLTWLEAADSRGPSEVDTRLVEQWISLNALYGRWDPERHEPIPDRLSVETFTRKLRDQDADSLMVSLLTEHKQLAISIFGDRYLSKHFWESEGTNCMSAERAIQLAREWYRESRWQMILDRLLDRICFVRCQVMHGGSTYGGKLNRSAVKRTSMMLGHIVPAALQVIMEHGYTDYWGELCYPPLVPRP